MLSNLIFSVWKIQSPFMKSRNHFIFATAALCYDLSRCALCLVGICILDNTRVFLALPQGSSPALGDAPWWHNPTRLALCTTSSRIWCFPLGRGSDVARVSPAPALTQKPAFVLFQPWQNRCDVRLWTLKRLLSQKKAIHNCKAFSAKL